MANPFNNLLHANEKDVMKCAAEICRTMHSRVTDYESYRFTSSVPAQECDKVAGKILAYANVSEHTLRAILLMMGE